MIAAASRTRHTNCGGNSKRTNRSVDVAHRDDVQQEVKSRCRFRLDVRSLRFEFVWYSKFGWTYLISWSEGRKAAEDLVHSHTKYWRTTPTSRYPTLRPTSPDGRPLCSRKVYSNCAVPHAADPSVRPKNRRNHRIRP